MLFNNMAFAYGKTGKTDDEIAAFQQAVEIRPSYATARYNNLGMAYLKMVLPTMLRSSRKIMTIDKGDDKVPEICNRCKEKTT